MRTFLKAVLPLALLLAVAQTLPLAAVLNRGFVHTANEPESHDVLLNSWILAWTAHAATTPGETVWDTNAFYPRRNTLAYSDHLLGNLPVTVPLLAAGANAILMHNTLVLLSFALSFVGMGLLARRLTGSTAAALVAGFVYAWCPYRFSNVERLQLLSSQWMPFCLLFVHRFLDGRRATDLLWAVLFAFAQAMVSCYYALMFPTFLAVWVGVYALVCRAVERRRALVGFACLLLCYVLVCLPFFWPYVALRREFDFRRDQGEVVQHSADIVHFLTAPESNVLYSRVLREWGGDGNELFPGLVAVGLAVVAVACARGRSRSAVVWPYAAAGLACAAFALGPVIQAAGHRLGPGPYQLLCRFAPGYSGLRNPTRFAMLFMLSLSVLSGMGFQLLLRAVRRPRVAGGLAALVLVVEYWSAPLAYTVCPHDDGIPEVYHWLARQDDVRVVLEVPFDLDVADRWYQYYSTYHWKQLVNGVSGWSPPEDVAKYFLASQLPSPPATQLLSDLGVDCILVHEGLSGFTEPGLGVVAQIGSTTVLRPTRPRLGLARPMPSFADCDRSGWTAAAHPHPQAASKALDGRLDTAWSTGRGQAPGDWFAVDFGAAVTVTALHLWLGPAPDQLPIEVEVQTMAGPDGPYEPLALNSATATFYRTCLLDHRRARLVIPFPATRCRRLRLVLRRVPYPAACRPWAIAEIAVFGPGAATPAPRAGVSVRDPRASLPRPAP